MSLVLFNSICLPQICFKVFSSLKKSMQFPLRIKGYGPNWFFNPNGKMYFLKSGQVHGSSWKLCSSILSVSLCCTQPSLWKMESGPIHTTIWRLNCVYGRREWSEWPATQIFKSCLCLSLYSAGLSFVLWVLVLFWVLLYVPFWSDVLCGLQKKPGWFCVYLCWHLVSRFLQLKPGGPTLLS